MQKVLHFDSPRAHYRCDAAVILCFDHRFALAYRKLIKRAGIEHPDRIVVAGGAKCLASPDPESERDFVLTQIRRSIRLHGTERVILTVHADCGAYGGAAVFGGDVQAEIRHHQDELSRAADCLHEHFPDLHVDCYLVDFEGVWAVQRTQSAG